MNETPDRIQPPDPLRVAVLLSGTGRTLENLLARRARGELAIDVPIVIASRADVRGVEVARAAGIETHVVTRKQAPTPRELTARVAQLLAPHDIELLALAGYLRQLWVPPVWEGRILNVHPSLLPLFGGRGFYGARVHEAALASGAQVSGCTVHLVNNEYDAGPIVLQRSVPVLPDDTPDALAARVFAAECEAYPEAIRAFMVALRGNREQGTGNSGLGNAGNALTPNPSPNLGRGE
jgi:formyltetrahydrofolate-dependent phosphoribosylglycinamide formyltransferase